MPYVTQAYLNYLEQQMAAAGVRPSAASGQQQGEFGNPPGSTPLSLDIPPATGEPPTTAPFGAPSQGGPGSYPNTGGPQVIVPSIPPYLENNPYQGPSATPSATPSSTPTGDGTPYQGDPSIFQNPFGGGDPGNAPFTVPGSVPYPTADPTGPGISAPGYDPGQVPTAPGVDPAEADPSGVPTNLPFPYPGTPQQYFDPTQPDLNVPFGSAGPPGAGPNTTPSPGAVATMTTLPNTFVPNTPANLGGSGFQNALFHGIWGGRHPMDFATWNAGAGTDQSWASRPGGTYQNYLNMWYAMRTGAMAQHPPPQAPGQGGTTGDWSGQGPGGAGRPVTAGR